MHMVLGAKVLICTEGIRGCLDNANVSDSKLKVSSELRQMLRVVVRAAAVNEVGILQRYLLHLAYCLWLHLHSVAQRRLAPIAKRCFTPTSKHQHFPCPQARVSAVLWNWNKLNLSVARCYACYSRLTSSSIITER